MQRATPQGTLYSEILAFTHGSDATVGAEPSPMYAVTMRTRTRKKIKKMDSWYHALAIGQSLPTLPIWLSEMDSVLLDLEASYEDSCRAIKIK